MLKNFKLHYRFFILVASLSSQLLHASQEFPHRSKFTDVPIISTIQLYKNLENALIVDVRSRGEYDVMHMLHAVNNPIFYSRFINDLKKIQAGRVADKLIFYCNGSTCKKSYIAARKAIEAGFRNVYAYDQGITSWAKSHPIETIMLGKTNATVLKPISDARFRQHLLSYAQFNQFAKKPNSLLIDIREPAQRTTDLRVKSDKLYFDKLIHRLKRKQWQNRTLLFFDAVGKQVRSLQYYLEKYGYNNYYFLENGIAGATATIRLK